MRAAWAPAAVLCALACAAAAAPEQVHVNPWNDGTGCTVLFVTDANSRTQPPFPASRPYVEWGESASGPVEKAFAHGDHYLPYDGDHVAWNGWIWRSSIAFPQSAPKIFYRACTGEGLCTEQLRMNAPRVGEYPFTLLAYADLGAECAAAGCGNATIDAMAAEVQRGSVGAMLNAGDTAYIANDEAVFDTFFRQTQGFAAGAVGVAAVGNHEHWHNFTGFRSRFHMPGPSESLWSAATVGPVRFVTWSTEHKSLWPGEAQYAFIERELAAADEARRGDPRAPQWIVVSAHRPLYCSTTDYDDCVLGASRFREHLEPLLARYGVDLAVYGHLHASEVTFPVLNGTADRTFQGANRTVHHVLGAAGDDEGLSDNWEAMPAYDAHRSAVLAYGRFTFESDAAVTFDLVSSSNASSVFSYRLTRAGR